MAEAANVDDGGDITDVEAKIIRQIEYYFGDHNLARDKFMQGVVKADGGWLPMETMVKFNRLKSLSTDYDVITNALKKSITGLIEISDDGKKIRRSPEKSVPDFDETWKQEVDGRTVYVKGFPQNLTLDELLEYFRESWKVDSVYMRRHFQKKSFKGSVFVTFKTKEAAADFMKEEEVKYLQTVLKTEMRADYSKRKTEEREEYHKRKQEKREQREKDAQEDKTVKQEEIHKGAVLHMNGFSKETAREDIKNAFASFATIKWVLFQRGQTEAWVQFVGENSAAAALEKLMEGKDDKLEIKGESIKCAVVEGDDEDTAIQKINQQREEVTGKLRGHKNRGGNFRGRGGGRGRHQHHGSRHDTNVKFQGKKRRFSDDEDTPNGKEVKTESVKQEADADKAPAKVPKVE